MIFLCNITAYFSYDYFSFLLKISAEYDNIIEGNYNCRGIVMKIAVCDDEQPFRKQIIKSLEEYFDSMNMEFHVKQFDNGYSLLQSEDYFDLIFMDYQMRNINGIDTIGALRKRNDNTTVVFVSSFPEVVFDSMKVHTYRFLNKPLENEKLKEALDSFIKENRQQYSIILFDSKYQKYTTMAEKSIIYAEADNVYCNIYTTNGTYRYKKTLSHFEKELKSDFFFKTHRSYIVNFWYIESYTPQDLSFSNGSKAFISKNRFASFQKEYVAFLKKKQLGILT